MTKLLLTFALVASLLAFMPATANAAPANNQLTIPIVARATNAAGQILNVSGQFNLTGFAVQGNQVVALGIVTGTAVNATTGAVTSFLQNVSTVTTPTAPSCPILHLNLGPITLNLLGLVITTNNIVIDITAVPGPGNLLGNLLCDIANLLNNPTQHLADVLNHILDILRGL